MNKMLLSAAIIATLGAAALVPQVATAASLANPVSNSTTIPDGTINITGTVIAQTCKVDGKSAGSADPKTVALPTVLTSQLASSGQTTGDTPFSISVTGCDSALSNVHTYFTGSNINSADGRLNNATGTATNVEVQLLNSDNSVISLNATDGSQNSKTVPLSGGNATLSYKARYYATGASGAGSVATSVAFTMVYQ